MSRFARDISDHELADYQRAVRLVLRHRLITASWPDDKALPRVRRFSSTLRSDLSDAFGYRLELHGPRPGWSGRRTASTPPSRPAPAPTGPSTGGGTPT